VASSAVKAAIDMNASLMAVVTNCLPAVRMLAKYRCVAVYLAVRCSHRQPCL
jgi:hypothetical protein